MARKPHDKASDADRAKYRHRATSVEMADPEQHPTDQAYKGTLFAKRLRRPIGLGDLRERRRRGKPWTPDLIEDVASMLEEGLFQYHVETLLGLSDKRISNSLHKGVLHERAMYDWDRRAEGMTDADAEAEFGPRPDVTQEMGLAARFRQSETLGEMTLFGAIINAALEGDPKAAQWMLERRHPKRYGRAAVRMDLIAEEDGHAGEAQGENARAKLGARITAMRIAIEA